MKPTVGRIVHFHYQAGNEVIQLPALVSGVSDAGLPTLHVFSYLEDKKTRVIFNVAQGDKPGQWDWMPYQKGQAAKTEELEKKIQEKDLGITQVRGAQANISDLQVFGDGDTFGLLCKASSQEQGWMKSTKVANVPGGCIVQVTTQQRNPDKSYAVAEALTYVPGVHMDRESEPRKLVPIDYFVGIYQGQTPDPGNGYILMGSENPSGWKLEELLEKLVKEVEHKTSKIDKDPSPEAQAVVENNYEIISYLTSAIIFQQSSMKILDAKSPNQGPNGTPRIGNSNE